LTDKDVLFAYRLKQAEETLTDAERMLQGNFSPRSIINRAYYSMFYAILALFLNRDIHLMTSKHSAIISIFDREFIHSGEVDRKFSKMLHKLFDLRQECDYKELVEISVKDVVEHVKDAKVFMEAIKAFINAK